MATSLSEINAQLAKLEENAKVLRQQADEIRRTERAAVIDELVKRIAEYGLTAADLKLSVNAGRRRKAPQATKATAKYRGPKGEEWSGGRGRRPSWVIAALASGTPLSDFEIR